MGEMKRSLVSTVGHARGEWASGRSASRQQALRGGEREEGGIQPDLGDLHRSIAKEIATLALALATTTTTTTKEKPEYEEEEERSGAQEEDRQETKEETQEE